MFFMVQGFLSPGFSGSGSRVWGQALEWFQVHGPGLGLEVAIQNEFHLSFLFAGLLTEVLVDHCRLH